MLSDSVSKAFHFSCEACSWRSTLCSDAKRKLEKISSCALFLKF